MLFFSLIANALTEHSLLWVTAELNWH